MNQEQLLESIEYTNIRYRHAETERDQGSTPHQRRRAAESMRGAARVAELQAMKLALVNGDRLRSTRQMVAGQFDKLTHVREAHPGLPTIPGFTDDEIDAGQQHVAGEEFDELDPDEPLTELDDDE